MNREIDAVIEAAEQEKRVLEIDDEVLRVRIQNQIDKIREIQDNSLSEKSDERYLSFSQLPIEKKIEILRQQEADAIGRGDMGKAMQFRGQVDSLLRK